MRSERAPEMPMRLFRMPDRDAVLHDDARWSTLAHWSGLSPRELEIVRGIFDDRKEETIADRLGISQHTVHTYLQRIYRKLEVQNRTGLVIEVLCRLFALRDQAAASEPTSRKMAA
jgi:DNA-binding CsgD family transcriptional regulator